jgi:hypothetical protein
LHTVKLVKSFAEVIALFVFKSFGGVAVGEGEGVGEGVGVGITTGLDLVAVDPSFQRSFLPLLVHMYFLPAKFDICPAFLQLPPTLMAAVASNGAMRAKTNPRESRILFMGRFLGFLKRIATTQLV